MIIKNIVFDFNGTILDDVDVSLDAINFCIEKYLGKQFVLDKKYYLDHFYFPVGLFYQDLGFDFNKIDGKEVSNDFISFYESKEDNNHLYPCVISLLKTLKDKKINIYLLSASYKALLEKQLKKYGIYEFFDGIIAIEDKYANGKIDAGKAYFASHPINKEETIMIGDTLHDYDVAIALGITPILFTKGHNSKEFLATKGCALVDSQDEVLTLITRN